MNRLFLENTAVLETDNHDLRKAVEQELTISNPKYHEARKAGRYTGNIDPELRYFEALPGGRLEIPRGAARIAHHLAGNHGGLEIMDTRLELQPLQFQFSASLRPYQQQAVDGILGKEFGVLQSGTGSGKTVMALAIIAARQQPTLVLVHTKELLYQWRDRIQSFLGLDAGLIGDGQHQVKPITVGIVNTVKKHLEDLSPRFGHLVVDECHRVPSGMFTETVRAFPARYMLGLSATPYRRDGLGRIIGWYMGMYPVTVDAAVLKTTGSVLRPEIIKRVTDFRYQYRNDYPKMISALVKDPVRNQVIASDIDRRVQGGKLALVCSDRVAHLEGLADLCGAGSQVLTGKTPAKKRQEIVAALDSGEVKVLFSTLALIGEGFDCPSMDSLFLATPIKFKGRLIQTMGRVLRPGDGGKAPVIYDYQDMKVGVLRAQALHREKIYQTM